MGLTVFVGDVLLNNESFDADSCNYLGRSNDRHNPDFMGKVEGLSPDE